jgi:hypothetical protein
MILIAFLLLGLVRSSGGTMDEGVDCSVAGEQNCMAEGMNPELLAHRS